MYHINLYSKYSYLTERHNSLGKNRCAQSSRLSARLAALVSLLLLLFAPNLAAQISTSLSGKPELLIEILYLNPADKTQPTYVVDGVQISDLAGVINNHAIIGADITGFTSPDGKLQYNRDLAYSRAKSFADLLTSQFGLSPEKIIIHDSGIDWDGLKSAVSQYNIPNADAIIDIIDNVPEVTTAPNGDWLDSRKKHLMDYNAGRSYERMRELIFPKLRRTVAILHLQDKEVTPVKNEMSITLEETPSIDTIQPNDPQPEVSIPEVPEEVSIEETSTEDVNPDEDYADPILDEIIEEILDETPAESLAPRNELKADFASHHVFAFRTNLLLPLLNLGVELPLGNRWSVGVDCYYPTTLNRIDNKTYLELMFVDAEIRCWLGHRTINNRLAGHSIAAYGAWGYYDVEFDYKGHRGHAYNFGLDYLYSLPVAKDKLHIDFEIAFGGILSRPAQSYNIREVNGRPINEPGIKKNFLYLGPTKIAITLVIPLSRKSVIRSSH